MTVRMLLHLSAIVALATVAAVTWVLRYEVSAVFFGIAALLSVFRFWRTYPEIYPDNERR